MRPSLLTLAMMLSTSPLLGLDLFVATDGNDRWSGRLAAPTGAGQDGPYATLERARDEIRRLKKDNTLPAGPVNVFLRAGVHALSRPFELTAADSGSKDAPITYRAWQSEQARLIGGREVTSFTRVTDRAVLARLDPAAKDQLYQADVKALGVTDFGEVVKASQRFELFFQDKPMTLARWPNEGFVKIVDVVGGEPTQIHGHKGDKIGKFTYEGDRPSRWKGEPDIRLLGYWFWDWADAYEKVDSIDTEKRIISTVPPYHHYGYRKGQRYCALNLLAELDSPGEWYLDRGAGILYFWPPAAIDSAKAFVSVTGRIVTLTGVSHVTLRGLHLEFSRGTAITVKDGSHNLVAGCTLRNLGGQAVTISGGTENGVVGCDIHDTGDGGITLDGGDRKTLAPGMHYAINNHIHDYSRTSKTYRTAVSTSGVGNRIANNLIHDAPHMALGLSGNEHLIELNEIHTVCMDTDDAGAFYMGRDWTWRGNLIRYNYFHHIGRFSGNVGVQSIYLDDWASGTTVFGNICYRGGRGILVGGGRNNTVENNVFVDCKPAVHVDSRGLGWAKYYFDQTDNTLVERLKQVPYQDSPWSTRYPELLTLYQDEPALAKYNAVVRNISTGGRWLDLLDGLTDKVVTVKDNLVDQDPHFVDPAKGDFRLKDDSPAFRLGFKQIPVEKIGLYKDELRASWPPPGRPAGKP
ncbi:MAG TPA: right-handed parallel beta-helix repeat-containing protein [Phycisphaerae bacterium]|nr:right-handed parallel beta-helix repeat-containing protein [Phycisphaerae bacterium]HRY67015.1 right-handed parallel beta-helix repeat-containing protein [Phycisphaerae bacterium]HSA28854.1 right-handed parallel beta-helix repeat-containing protein [Phycisphaerae bacterium]